MMKLIPLSFYKILQSRAYTMIVLATAQKKFGIYTEPKVGKMLQKLLLKEPSLRPATHDLLSNMLKGLHVSLKQVVINRVEDTIYFSRLYLEHPCGETLHILEIDARPSDALILTLMYNTPLYCSEEVLEQTIALDD